MKFDLYELNQFSVESIQLEFMKTPLSERIVEIHGDFNLSLIGCRVIKAMPFIPLHVDTIKFTGSFCYHVESFDSSESREVIPDQVLCFVGPSLHQFVAAIPKHVVNIIFHSIIVKPCMIINNLTTRFVRDLLKYFIKFLQMCVH